MRNIILLIMIFFCLSCSDKKITLTNTNWKAISLELDSTNTLSPFELNAARTTDSLLKSSALFSSFTEDKAIIHFEGKVPDTTSYFLRSDTLFYIQNHLRDTNIVIKLTPKELITRSVSGITAHFQRIFQ